MKIAAVVEQTGVSKELIHHYLRQGLLPSCAEKGRYDRRQVRLLALIRALRDEHHLPLETIRRVFALLDFDPARLELLACSESLSRRVERFAGEGAIGESSTLSADALAEAAEVSVERLADYRRAKLIAPLPAGPGEPERFCSYSANTVALCERGLELGVAFESFRTVASHVSLAYELDHGEFLGLSSVASLDGERIVADLFVRSELAASFVQNVLAALMTRRLRSALVPRFAAGFDQLIYRPSAMFLARHGIEGAIERARRDVGDDGDDARRWSRAAALLLHAGRYREAVFFLEQALSRWPLDRGLRAAFGRALLLGGDDERGRETLARVACETDPCSCLLLAFADLTRVRCSEQPEALLKAAAALRARVEDAVHAAAASADDAVRLESTMLGGWLLAAMPEALAAGELGRSMLAAALAELDAGALVGHEPAGLHERQRINCAYLLLERGGRDGAGAGVDELAALVCRLDPGSAFAESAFLSAGRRDADAAGSPRGGSRLV